MLIEIFDTIAEVVTQFITLLTTGFTEIVKIFYVAPVEGVGGGLTMVGILSLIVVGISLVWMLFNFIRSAIRLRG